MVIIVEYEIAIVIIAMAIIITNVGGFSSEITNRKVTNAPIDIIAKILILISKILKYFLSNPLKVSGFISGKSEGKYIEFEKFSILKKTILFYSKDRLSYFKSLMIFA